MSDRQRSIRLEAVVLRHLEMGEADRLLTLFTREQGKLRAIAKGVRKIRSRKSGHLQPFTRSSLQLARGRDMMIVTQAETLDAYLPLHQDWVLTSYAAYVVELLDRFTFEEGENQALYRLLVETLQRLSAGDLPEQVVRYYELRLLDLVGFRPQLFQCVRCNRAVQPEDQFFSAELGGALCPRCGPAAPGARPVTLQTLKYLRHFQRSPYQEAARAPLTPMLNREMETLMQHYLTHLLERGLNTPPFLRRARSSRLDTADAQPPDAQPPDARAEP